MPRRGLASRTREFALRSLAMLIGVLLLIAPAWAHVGNPDVYFQGAAGPYHLIITIRTPQMIPGTADVEILSATPGISKITVVPLYIVGPGAKYPPVGDLLAQSKEDSQYFSGKIWLMESGSWQVRVQVEGAQGVGELAVPVPAAARRTLPMQRSLGMLLFALMSLLVVAIISIAGAARREATLSPGELPSAERSRRGRWMMLGTGVLVFGILYFGNWWWNSEASAKARQMIYKPPPLDVSLEPGGKLLLKMGDSAWHRNRPETVMTNLLPDHGHLMHLFLLREPGMDRFYHLHPQVVPLEPGLHASNAISFETDLPAIPAGRYQVFADVVRESGFPDTMIAETDLPDIPGVALAGDNSAAASSPLIADGTQMKGTDEYGGAGPASNATVTVRVTPDGTTATLPDGYKMIWERGTAPFTANHFVWLRFHLETPDGKPVTDAEPYMGMAGHAEIVDSDRSVFAHIHPDGSVAMAALELAQKNSAAGMVVATRDAATNSAKEMAGMSMSMSMAAPSDEVSFPYGFPKAGEYRLFIQMKRGGTIETGVFDTEVVP
ncbi:MAG: hypothetical protein ABSC10_06130 [Candidatus Acidiferrales bacterium]